MKKRIISMLLTVLMVMSLFSGLPLNAYAATTTGANTIQYTMAAGDYVLRICQKLGLNYYTCKDAIMILNNIYDGQWNKLTVGRTLTLPASDADAILIANGAALTNVNSGATASTVSATYNTGTATTGTSVATTTTFKAANTADSLAYYLVPYTISAGETVSGVCNSLGVNFNIFSPFIKQVNGISDWTKVRAGQTLIIPTPVCPSVGTSCYGVMQHMVNGSDTAYGITSANGVNYNANKTLLEVLNQTSNLGAISVGSWFYYPVPLTVSVAGTGNPGITATTTTTTTTTDGNGTTTTTSTTTSKLYKLTGGMSASDGTMLFYVDNKAVTAAPAGAKVTIVTDTYSGRAIQSLTVKHSDDKADLHLSADTFIMPSCDVRVDCEIKTGHDININANYSNKACATFNGVTVQSAVKNEAIVIKSNDPNYEISAVYATYRKVVSASTKTVLTVSSSNAFIMPDADVDVEVTLKPISTYAFYVIEPTPARGSFYLKVNGNAVTRAAKGAQVTVVAQAIDGYEPVALSVTNHVTGAAVNVFSNTFTMPAFDVDVSVRFGAKGNNIVIMPSQVGNVYAYSISSPSDPLDETEVIEEADTNSIVYLAAFDEDDNQLTTAGYDIEYDVVRNLDGLKVTVDMTGAIGSFRMPKGGVTVTPIITVNNPVEIFSEFFVNNIAKTAGDGYNDCSFSVTWNNKTSEFTKTGDQISKLKQIKSYIPEGEYIDLRYDCSDGVAFVKYRIVAKNGGELFEEATNEANLYGYFKLPGKDIEIEAYFETGKVPMGPAAITGIGSVGYKVVDGTGWKSANTCNPGDEVLIVVTSGNGYKFDFDKYESKLIVSRKDNGAPLTLKPVYPAPSWLDPNSYAFTFTMPASGVDVQAIFDPKPFIITMKCVDETGNDLTGLGLWQIAIDWVPGVLDNATNITWTGLETQFEVAYGDYVTVAMTEAGWSKYDMVSFRIDDLQYTADELNYFYNFQMIEDRAKDLTITAVLRPKNISIHTLSAVYDTTKIGVEFLIIDSPTHYSDEYRFNNSGALNYVSKAITGDKIAIVANSVDSKYSIEKKDITITTWGGDADSVVPTEAWIYSNGTAAAPGAAGAFRVFTFTMPDGDVYVTINVSGTQHGLFVSVYDATDNTPINGMVRVFATTSTGATISRDVGNDVNFDDIAYKSTVQVLRSELALAEGKVIKDVEISTASGKSINYTDMTSAGEGIYFTMPDEAVWVIIRIDSQHYNIPVVVVDTQVKNGTLIYRKGPNVTDPVCDLSDFKAGEIVYVFDEPSAGYAHLGLGDLKIYVNGMNNAVNVQTVTTSPHVWSFTMPEGTIIMQATFPEKEDEVAELTIKFYDKDAVPFPTGKVKVTVNGYTAEYEDGDTLKAYEDYTVTFVSATDGYEVTRVLSKSGKGISGINTYTVPDLTKETPANEDTISIYLESSSGSITWKATGGSLLFQVGGNYVVTANEGDPVTIEATPDSGYKALEAVNLLAVKADGSEEIIPVTYAGDSGNVTYWTFTMPAGGVLVGAAFEKDDQVNITFAHADAKMFKLSVDGLGETIPGSDITFPLTTGMVVKIEPAEDGCDKVKVTAPSIGTKTGTSVSYTVPDTSETVVIEVVSTAKAVTLKSMSYGKINLRKDNDKNKETYTAANFDMGDEIYIEVVPNLGYKLKSLKAVRNTDSVDILDAKDTTTDLYPIQGVYIPDGGITISAEFELRTDIILNITVNGSLPTDVIVANVSTGNGITGAGGTITATFGQTITISPASGYKWDGGMTVNGSPKTSFTINSTDPYNIVLDLTTS